MLHLLLSLLPFLNPEFPGQCDDLTTVMGPEGPRLRRVRREFPKREVVRIIRTVAEEMGADPHLLIAIAKHESSLQPSALHVLDGDQIAGLEAWRAGTFSQARWDRYQTIVDQGTEHPSFYRAKLGQIRMKRYEGNSFWHTQIQRGGRDHGVWTWGYGLYGMAPVLYVGIWDTHSPPWVLCDPKVATVTLIWALRAQRADCAAKGEAGTVQQTIARYASGHCGKPIRRHWNGVLKEVKKVDLGTKWPQATTDRSALIQAIVNRSEAIAVRG